MKLNRLVISLLAAAGMLATTSCVNESLAECPVTPIDEEARMVHLTFSVVAPSASTPLISRASEEVDKDNYFEEANNKYELIHTIRIIILRPDGTIEHNKVLSFGQYPVAKTGKMEFLVHAGELKKIYILGNIENLSEYNFEDLEEGKNYNDFSNKIEDIIFETGDNYTLIDNSSEGTNYIPMSEVHEIRVEDPGFYEDQYQDIGSLFITRAAVKFSFSFQADAGENLYIKNISFYNIATKEYFLPKETKYYPPKEEEPLQNWNGEGVDPDLYGRFITEYQIPPGTPHQKLSFTPSGNGIPLFEGVKNWSPALYYCESQNDDPYKIDLTIGTENGDDNITYTFDKTELPNLSSLPRNTHVKLNVVISENKIYCDVVLIPYIEVELDPLFGFEELKPKKDENTQD